MGYQHIDNLYKNQTILAQPECYALEKIHGTSAHIAFGSDGSIRYFSGGEKHEKFVKLFDEAKLLARFQEYLTGCESISAGVGFSKLVIYGEAYGGKCQGMSATYGPEFRFVAFEAKQDDGWLPIPGAEHACKFLGIEFVHYKRINTDMASINAERDADSVQAVRNGMGPGKIREGVVLFPLTHAVDFRGNRVMAKHKRDEFRETASPRVVTEVPVEIVNAQKAAHEFVTEMRLTHVLDKIPGHKIEMMRDIMAAMTEDILREGAGEVVDSPALRKEICRRTAILYKDQMKKVLV